MPRSIKLWLLFVFAGVVGWSGIAAFKTSQPTARECEALFSSGLYQEYRRQLTDFVRQNPHYPKDISKRTVFTSEMQQLLGLIEMPLAPDPGRQREQHESFLLAVRKVAADKKTMDSKGSSRGLFEEIIRWIYFQADLSGPAQSFLQEYLPLRAPEQSIYDYLMLAQRQMHRTLRLNRQKQNNFAPEDHYFVGNLPVAMGLKVGNTTLIRLAQPLIGNSYLPSWMAAPSPSPEFMQFLRQQKHHLYVNLMRSEGVEAPLTAALEGLESVVPSLSVVSLDKDSDFYWQKEPSLTESIISRSFKIKFVEKMTDPQGSFYWPARLNLRVWREQLQAAVEQVHQKYFTNKVSLNRAERLDFIELTYLAIINALVKTLHPSSMNITCRHSMDRGPSLMALWLLEQKKLNEVHLTPFLLVPPLIIHQRTSHESRLERFISAAKRFVM